MVDILRKFIRAERTGNWAWHLQAIQGMLPYLAVSGHNLCTKSDRVYLHPDVPQHFDDGFHVIRLSDRH